MVEFFKRALGLNQTSEFICFAVFFKARAEKEIRDLGAVKEKLEAEWELVKFMGQVWKLNLAFLLGDRWSVPQLLRMINLPRPR